MYLHCKYFSKGYTEVTLFFSFLLRSHSMIIIGSISGPPVFYKYFTSVTIKLFFKSKWFFRMTISKGKDSKSSLVTYFIHRSLYICKSQSPNSPSPTPIPLGHLQVCSQCLCLYFCFANDIIFTIFLDFTQMC